MYPMYIYLIIIFPFEQSNICSKQNIRQFPYIPQVSDRIYGC